jgi:hypothetical protein
MASIPSRFQGPLGEARDAAPSAARVELSGPAHLLLASLSGAAGVIHLVMVPSHMDEWALEGIGFALAGWFQLVFAALVLLKPSKVLLTAGIAVNAALIAAWAVSRTAGIPFGPHAGHPETASFIDLACVGIEAGLIALAALLVARPEFGSSWTRADAFVLVSAGVLALATAAVVSPSARNHAAGAHGDHHAVDDKGLSLLTNGHHHEIQNVKLDPATQEILDEQLDVTRDVARKYPTVADAEAAGYRRAGPYSPGLGAHYIAYGGDQFNADGIVDDNDLAHPLAIIYDGTDPDSEVAGFMYYSMSEAEPQGFVGPNDTWHYHENICIKMDASRQIEAPLGADREVTNDQCAAVGGSLLPVTQWMVHVWSVPGYDNVDGGVFAEVNPALDCADGTYYQLPIEEWAANPLDVCRAQVSR